MTTHDHLSKLTNVFVLMLENHSFDNIFAGSGIPGLHVATATDSNSFRPAGKTADETVFVHSPAPPSMSTDPGHEFDDVLLQLCGSKKTVDGFDGGPYPDIDMCGFASSYATSQSEGTGMPSTAHVRDIMAVFDTPTQLPVIHALATEFAVCDHWHSSIPGPTWPNRFFVHGASSSGWTESPKLADEAKWMSYGGFEYENGSIFDRLTDDRWRLYQDKDNAFSDGRTGHDWMYGGWISQVASLAGVSLTDVHSLTRFEADLNATGESGQPDYHAHPYTFIEPNFGRSFFAKQKHADGSTDPGPTYMSGSSQHPEDDPSGGEGLIKFVYETIRASPVWNTSLLIVVYDEHGGFYDSCPPPPAPPPGDVSEPNRERLFGTKDINPRNFGFDRFGVRVPAVIVSPLIPKGTVDHAQYDHASVLATVERWLGLDPLTERDRHASDLGNLLSLDAPRECPTQLPAVAKYADLAPIPEGDEDSDAPLPKSGNLIGFLHVLLKHELSDGDLSESDRQGILDTFGQIKTKGEAVAYVKRMHARLDS